MPGFTEQQREWKREIKETEDLRLFSGTAKEFSITPGERLRYEADAAFASLLVDDLRWLSAQPSSLTEEVLLKHQAELSPLLQTDDQRRRVTAISEKLQVLLRQTAQIGRKELLHRLQQWIDHADQDVDTGSSIQLSAIDRRDIEVTPFGAILITVRDRHIWEDELEFSPTAYGMKMLFGPIKGMSTRLQEAMNRVVFFNESDGATIRPEQRSHELFHDLYHRVFKSSLNNRYRLPTQKTVFSELQNELIAYALSEQWNANLRDLLSSRWGQRGEKTNPQLRQLIKQRVLEEGVAAGVGEAEAMKIAQGFSRMIQRAQSEITRLSIKQSQAFTPALIAALSSGDMKELVYHLAQIDPEPLDPDVILPKNPDGTVFFDGALTFGRDIADHLFSVRHLGSLIDVIEQGLRVEAAKEHPREFVLRAGEEVVRDLKKSQSVLDVA